MQRLIALSAGEALLPLLRRHEMLSDPFIQFCRFMLCLSGKIKKCCDVVRLTSPRWARCTLFCICSWLDRRWGIPRARSTWGHTKTKTFVSSRQSHTTRHTSTTSVPNTIPFCCTSSMWGTRRSIIENNWLLRFWRWRFDNKYLNSKKEEKTENDKKFDLCFRTRWNNHKMIKVKWNIYKKT